MFTNLFQNFSTVVNIHCWAYNTTKSRRKRRCCFSLSSIDEEKHRTFPRAFSITIFFCSFICYTPSGFKRDNKMMNFRSRADSYFFKHEWDDVFFIHKLKLKINFRNNWLLRSFSLSNWLTNQIIPMIPVTSIFAYYFYQLI